MRLANFVSNENSSPYKQKFKVLIVEDEVLFARAVMRRLQKANYECAHVESVEDARNIVKQFSPDIVLLDMRLPDGNGIDLIPFFVGKSATVTVMTAHGDISDAVNAMKLGAIDYLKKPIDLEELFLSVKKAEATALQNNSLDYSRQRNVHAIEGAELLGDSHAIQSIKAQITRISQIVANDSIPPTVLINGETGTGKDVAARLIHLSCHGNDKPFVHVDCASLPAELIESELFGHEKGAFTGATDNRPGLIEAAEDGTLFLDEIGELPLALQAKLLNVLERRMVRRIGSTKERPVLARFIAATNRDLHEMSLQGGFRQDLYYRLNVMNLVIPPLRERLGDLVLLAEHFSSQTSRRYGLPKPVFTPEALDKIRKYSWPGNVRELKHQISRAVLLCGELGRVTEGDLALPGVPLSSCSLLGETEKILMLQALTNAKNNVSKAARELGISRMAMRYRMEKHNIQID